MQYISGRRINQDFGVPGITTNDTVVNVDGRIAVGIGTTATANVDTNTLRVRDTVVDANGFSGELGYFLTKDSDGLIWTEVSPITSNSIFVADNGNILGVSSFTGLNIISDQLLGVTTNTTNPNFADIRIDPRWFRDRTPGGGGGIYTTGTVGIGSTQPRLGAVGVLTDVKLDVIGDAIFSGIISASSFVGEFDVETQDLEVSGIATFSGTEDNILGNVNTGAVQIDGGVGIEKNVSIGQTLQVGSAVTIGNGTVSAITGDFVNLELENLNVSGFSTFGNVARFDNSVNIFDDLFVSGNISVGGTGVTLDTETIRIEGKELLIGFTTTIAPNDTTANAAGIAVASTEGKVYIDLQVPGINTTPNTYKQIKWFKSGTLTGLGTDAFISNQPISIATSSITDGQLLTVGDQIQFTETQITAPTLDVSGISTLGVVQINSGIITNTSSGVAVTVYGNLIGTASTASFATTAYNLDGFVESDLNVATAVTATNVIGGIGSITSLDVSGISTLGVVQINSGIITNTSSGVAVTVYGNLIGTASTASFATTAYNLDGFVESDLNVAFAQTAGIATTATNVIGGIGSITSLDVSGISTLGVVQISSGIITATTGIITYYGGFVGNLTGTASTASFATTAYNLDGFVESDLNVAFAQTAGIATTATNVIGGIGSITSLDVSGITTLGTVQISSGIITATTGIITYYGGFVGNLTGTASTASFATTAYNLDGFVESDLNVAFAQTAGIATTATNVIGGIGSITSLDVSGISTLGVVEINAGIITNTSSGVAVTVYGNLIGTASTASFATTAYNLDGFVESDLNVAFAQTAGIATNLVGGVAGQISYQSLPNVTGFLTTGTLNQVLTSQGPGLAPIWTAVGSASAIEGITIKDEGEPVGSAGSITNIDFVGNGVVATATSGGNIATITISQSVDGSGGIANTATNVIGGIGSITSLDVSGIATINSGILTDLSVSGIATINSGILTDLSVSGIATINSGIITDLKVTGVSTLGVVQINSGIITNTSSGVAVTVYGNLIGTASTASFATTAFNLNGVIELGTDTTGDYVESVSGTANEIVVTGGTGEGSTPQIGLPNDVTISQDLTVTRDVEINRNLNVGGNITIGGTSATLFTQTLTVADADLILGVRTDALGNDISTDNTANHGGIAIASTEGTPLVTLANPGAGETLPSTYKKIMWFKSGSFSGLGTDAWLSNYAIGIGSTQFPTGTRLAAGNVQFTENDLSVVRNINASGIATIGSVQINAGIITATSGIVTYYGGFVGNLTGTASTASFATTAYNLDGFVESDLNVAFAQTAGIATTATNVIGGIGSITSLDVSGITTLGTVQISSGIITATSGIVTYYGGFVGNLTGTASTASFATTAYNLDGFVESDLNVAFAQTAGIATYTSEWTLGANGSSDYRFTGPGFDGTENDPTIYLTRGEQYKFTNNMGAHPFEIRTAINGSAYSDGIVNNGVSNGTLTWNVQMDAPDILYYQCTSHAGMVGKIYIVNAGIASDVNLYTTGIATIGSVQINAGIITATTGIITYYGDGQYLQNITSSGGGGISSITISNNTLDQSQYLTYAVSTGNTTGLGVTTEGLVFNPFTGSMGIGQTLPQAKLDINVGTGLTALNIEGSEGQLFSITNNLTSGSIFSVSDVSGVPSIDVDADGTIQLAPFGSTEYVGIGTTNPTQKLDVNGNIRLRGALYDNSNGIGATSQVLTSTGSGISWQDAAVSGVGIQSGGTVIGTGITTLNFVGAGSTFAVNGTTVDISVSAGTTRTVSTYTATSGQTTFSATYNVGYVDVFLNGAKLSGNEYTATNGTSIVLDTGASENDIVEVVGYSNINIAGGSATPDISPVMMGMIF